MKFLSSIVALALVAGLVSVAEAKKSKGPADLVGQITTIDASNPMKLTITGGKKKSPTSTDVTCDDKTTVTIDGKDAKVADLKVGLYVTISPETGTPTSITATTDAPPKKSKKSA